MASDAQEMMDIYGSCNGYFSDDGQFNSVDEEEWHATTKDTSEYYKPYTSPKTEAELFQPNYEEYMAEEYVSPFSDIDYERTSQLIRKAEARLEGIINLVTVIPQELHQYAWTIIKERTKPELAMTAFLAADAMDQDPRINLITDGIPF